MSTELTPELREKLEELRNDRNVLHIGGAPMYEFRVDPIPIITALESALADERAKREQAEAACAEARTVIAAVAGCDKGDDEAKKLLATHGDDGWCYLDWWISDVVRQYCETGGPIDPELLEELKRMAGGMRPAGQSILAELQQLREFRDKAVEGLREWKCPECGGELVHGALHSGTLGVMEVDCEDCTDGLHPTAAKLIEMAEKTKGNQNV